MNIVDSSSILPVVGPMGSLADFETYKLDQITTYTVHDGDTLSKIADMFGVSVATIYWSNNLKQGDQIKVGDILVILPITGIQYQAKKGDTAASLAKKYKSDAQDIIAYNDLPADGYLEEGATIIIPDAELGQIPGAQPKSQYYGGGGPEIAGYFMRPIFGGRKSQGLHGFNGVDLANSCGTPVYASAGGTVIVARSTGWNGGYGRYIVIAHPNGTQTVYAHLSLVNVNVGQYVPQGHTIGGIGSSGNSTGCHVHFEVRGAKNPF
ncbi:MAG: Peptidase M23 family protein [Candidatus Giovannonibacteria bacterium GW2011_GWA1_43_15]|nr:MAG: Peptidase M23 family protein [Candidatus Giovannonibacteria bacterium GW2011_GWB1_43_13]KKS99034.1 MAG: Peptidase M23 family protein [Candidatus Giovannonibacteria bacterium GW2011_GWA1_43_15]KKT20953.1 MAG: Peptidase M23 family protein [Candidatus Giovannonibacteria bacterium GW2011_GWC2_43_8]KKT62364.1 MAG: Peptidase M23 family protein [Candidatus Giovannonibacteria bacterium GW2011_GWA2_44_26]